MAKIGEFEIIDHGIEHPQYFQGCGTSFTSYTHVATGIGSNFAEAYEDACEYAAQGPELDMSADDWTAFDKRVLKDIGRRSFPKRPAVTRKHNEECYYRVSIRYNVKPTPLTAAQLAIIPDPVLTDVELDDIADTMRDDYRVIVGNIGTVLETANKDHAERTFAEYVEMSKAPYGRASNECVTLWRGEDILNEYLPTDGADAYDLDFGENDSNGNA